LLRKFLSQVLCLPMGEQLIAILPDPDTLNAIERGLAVVATIRQIVVLNHKTCTGVLLIGWLLSNGCTF
jgi:hypothetical protein